MTQISRLHADTIATGSLAKASDINDELNQEVNESNSQDTRITTLESGNTTITGNKTYSGTQTFNGAVTLASTVSVTGTLNLGLLADPVSPAEGMAWGNTTSHLFKYHDGTTTQTVAFLSNLGDFPTGFRSGSHPTWTSISSVTIHAGYACRDDSDTVNIVVPSDIIVSMATSGAAGLVTAETEATSAKYYLYLGKGTSGVTGVFSSDPALALTSFPAGYNTYKQRFPGCWRNNSSGDLLNVLFSGDLNFPDADYIVETRGNGASSPQTEVVTGVSTGGLTTFTDADLSSYVPSDAKKVRLQFYSTAASTAYIRPKGSTLANGQVITIPVSNSVFQTQVITNSSQVVQFANNSAQYIGVLGYKVTEAS